MLAFDNFILLQSVNTISLIFDAMKAKEISYGQEFKPLSTLNVGMQLSTIKINKTFLIFFFVLYLYCIRNIYEHLVKSSTMVRKKCALKRVETLCRPQVSQCNKNPMEHELIWNLKETEVQFFQPQDKLNNYYHKRYYWDAIMEKLI